MNKTDWSSIMPDVARTLLGEPKTKRRGEWRYRGKGSLKVDIGKGSWDDFEEEKRGGVLDLVERELKTDRKGALDWLQSNGLIENKVANNRRGVRVQRPQPKKPSKPKPKQNTPDWMLRWWRKSEPIGEHSEHPFRRWTTTGEKPHILHPYCRVPAGIRWHSYRGGVILCGVFPLQAWGSDGIPSGEPVAVQALAIDGQGKNRFVLGENKDLRRCSYGPVSAGVFLLGDRESERVNIVEGVADALAVYSRVQGAVVATLGSSKKLVSQAGVIDWLIQRQTWIFPDRDNAGDKGTMALAEAIKTKSPGAPVFTIDAAEDFEDPGEWAEQTPFPLIDQYDFDEKSGMLYDSGLPWGEADRTTIYLLMKRILK